MALSESAQILIQEFGLDRTLEFIKKYSGKLIYVPSWSTISQHLRNVELVVDFRKGMNLEGLATKYQMSEDMVIRALELSGEKWGLAEQNKNLSITCAICGGQFKQLTKSHLELHGYTMQRYREEYPGNEVESERYKKQHENFESCTPSGDDNPAKRPEVREKMSEGKKQNWDNPKKRRRMREAQIDSGFGTTKNKTEETDTSIKTGRYGGKKHRKKTNAQGSK